MKRNHIIEIRLSEDEFEKIKNKSDSMGLTISSFLRLVACNSKIEIKT
jgi:predicted DNA binding CopG/RHH family protein